MNYYYSNKKLMLEANCINVKVGQSLGYLGYVVETTLSYKLTVLVFTKPYHEHIYEVNFIAKASSS